MNCIGAALFISGFPMFVVGMLQLPQTPSTVQTTQPTKEEQTSASQQLLIHSHGFLLAMIGLGLCLLGALVLVIKNRNNTSVTILPFSVNPIEETRIVVAQEPPKKVLKSALKSNI